MDILHLFSNCVKATFKHVLSPSEVDRGDPKAEPTKHGPSLKLTGKEKCSTTPQVDA